MVDPVGERSIELDDLRLQQQDVPQTGEAGTGVVDGDPGSSSKQGLHPVADRTVVGHRLVLGQLEHQARARRVVGEAVEHPGHHQLG